MKNKRSIGLILALVLLLPAAIILHFSCGEISLSFSDLLDAFQSYDSSNAQHVVVREFRLPRILMAIIAGAGLSVSGLLMQTLFNNPLAGPYVLGINSGASLAVAATLLAGWSIFQTDFGLVGAALIGSLSFGLLILGISFYLRNSISLLLIGLMLGSFSGALVSIMQYLSEAQALKLFTLWALGSLQNTQWSQMPFIFGVFAVGLIGCFLVVKPLNAYVLGETQARHLGVSVKTTRFILISITAVLTGLVTAYCGPIAFLGLAVPNLVKILFKTQEHFWLICGSAIAGAIFLLICDSLVQLSVGTLPLPINAVTSLVGAPMVIYYVIKKLA